MAWKAVKQIGAYQVICPNPWSAGNKTKWRRWSRSLRIRRSRRIYWKECVERRKSYLYGLRGSDKLEHCLNMHSGWGDCDVTLLGRISWRRLASETNDSGQYSPNDRYNECWAGMLQPHHSRNVNISRNKQSSVLE